MGVVVSSTLPLKSPDKSSFVGIGVVEVDPNRWVSLLPVASVICTTNVSGPASSWAHIQKPSFW